MIECNLKVSGTTKNKQEDEENKQGKNYFTMLYSIDQKQRWASNEVYSI